MSLKKFKPDLSDKSLKVYTNTINKILKDLNGCDDLECLKNTKEVIKYLDNKNVSFLTKRNYYNTIIVFMQAKEMNTDIIKVYQDKRDKLNDEYMDFQKSGKKSEKQQKAWASLNELIDVKNKLKKETDIINKKDKYNKKDLQTIQNYFILTFYLDTPLRNDLNNTKVIKLNQYNKLSNEDKNSFNYMVYGNKNFLSLSQYKTAKKYGLKIINLNNDTIRAFRLWYDKFNPNKDYLLINLNTNEPMTSHQLTITLTKLFKKYLNKNISTTMLRHIVLSEKFGDVKKEMEDMAEKMGHDVNTQQQIYVKN
mgnify:CR=1 FL=1|tara:strand:- start:2457 stop:3383 length:927 start_codon:yes stop_codon:yes gene_type:complete